jgi:hypothetical protein
MYTTVIFPFVLYQFEIVCWTLWGESGVLKKAFRINREEVTGYWRQLHNGELHDLCCSPNTYYSADQIEKDKVGGACSMYGENALGLW